MPRRAASPTPEVPLLEPDAQPLEEWLHDRLVDAYGVEREAWATERVARTTARLNAVRLGKPALGTEILWIREVTAFTTPGRWLYVSRRLLERCASDDPVAFMIAHEMAHHDLGHLALFHGWSMRLPRLGAARLIATAVRQLERRYYGPENEVAADAQALRLCHAAGYDLDRCLGLFTVLEQHALDLGAHDVVFGLDEDPEPPNGTVEEWLQQARTWTWQRLNGYPSLRERVARLRELQRTLERAASPAARPAAPPPPAGVPYTARAVAALLRVAPAGDGGTSVAPPLHRPIRRRTPTASPCADHAVIAWPQPSVGGARPTA